MAHTSNILTRTFYTALLISCLSAPADATPTHCTDAEPVQLGQMVHSDLFELDIPSTGLLEITTGTPLDVEALECWSDDIGRIVDRSESRVVVAIETAGPQTFRTRSKGRHGALVTRFVETEIRRDVFSVTDSPQRIEIAQIEHFRVPRRIDDAPLTTRFDLWRVDDHAGTRERFAEVDMSSLVDRHDQVLAADLRLDTRQLLRARARELPSAADRVQIATDPDPNGVQIATDPDPNGVQIATDPDPNGVQIATDPDPNGVQIATDPDPNGVQIATDPDPNGVQIATDPDPNGVQIATDPDPNGVQIATDPDPNGSRASATTTWHATLAIDAASSESLHGEALAWLAHLIWPETQAGGALDSRIRLLGFTTNR